jgi:hypothetical protein
MTLKFPRLQVTGLTGTEKLTISDRPIATVLEFWQWA